MHCKIMNNQTVLYHPYLIILYTLAIRFTATYLNPSANRGVFFNLTFSWQNNGNRLLRMIIGKPYLRLIIIFYS